METVAQIWESFEKKILDPINAPPVQRHEMRKAFYAGFGSGIAEMAKAGDNPNEHFHWAEVK